VDRRRFIAGAVAVVAAPLVAEAQQADRMRRIGVLIHNAEDDPESKAELAAFRKGLQQLGWSEDRNMGIDTRFAADRPDQYQVFAKELVALQPNAIFAYTTPLTAALQRESRTIPIVFVEVSDPVGSGLIASLARPGGNVTGLLLYEQGITGKWAAILKEIAPHLKRAALRANPKTTPYDYFVRSANAVARSLAIELVPSPVENAADIERVIAAFARTPSGGLLVLPSGTTSLHRNVVVGLAARYRLPAGCDTGLPLSFWTRRL